MDVIAQKVKAATSILATGQNSGTKTETGQSILGNFALTFTEFLDRASSGVLNGQTGKNGQNLIGAVAVPSKRPDPAPKPQARAETADTRESPAHSAIDDDSGHHDGLPARIDTSDDHRDSGDSNTATSATGDADTDHQAPAESHDDATVDASSDTNPDDRPVDDGTQKAASTDKDAEPDAAPSSKTAASSPTDTRTDQAANVLAGLLNMAKGIITAPSDGKQASGQGAAHAAQGSGAETGRANAAEGLATALSNVTKPTAAAATTGVSENGGEAQRGTSANFTAATTAATQTTGRGTTHHTGATPATSNQAQGQAGAETVSSEAGKQAQDMSRRLGPDQRVTVQVQVTKESETLVSQPVQARVVLDTASEQGPARSATQTQGGQAQQVIRQLAAVTPETIAQNQNQAQARQGDLLAEARATAAMASGRSTASTQGPGSFSTAPTSAGGTDAGTPGPNAPAQTQTAGQAAAKVATPHFTRAHQTVTNQVTVQITKAINTGLDKINIQLRPAHLGRVDIQLELGGDGRVTAVITADTKETLDLLQRDARDLERALQNAGLQANAGSMSFNLRGETAGGKDGNGSVAGGDVAKTNNETDQEVAIAAEYENGIRADGRVDIRA